jgi:hypothetical protein
MEGEGGGNYSRQRLVLTVDWYSTSSSFSSLGKGKEVRGGRIFSARFRGIIYKSETG